jgi:hypothetical protein
MRHSASLSAGSAIALAHGYGEWQMIEEMYNAEGPWYIEYNGWIADDMYTSFLEGWDPLPAAGGIRVQMIQELLTGLNGLSGLDKECR